MESLGEFLRKERESRKIALENIARESKVNMHYLSLLERNELNKLPLAYAKGYLRAYCSLVGLDNNEVFSRYSYQLTYPEHEEKAKEKEGLLARMKVLIGSLTR
jgi:cytoskeleton protein RodZ